MAKKFKLRDMKQFYRLLSKTSRDWYFKGDDIRQKGINSDRCKCPVTAVVYEKTGVFFHESDYVDAAESIGMKYRDAARIVDAADGDPDHPVIRKKLVKACGLEG